MEYRKIYIVVLILITVLVTLSGCNNETEKDYREHESTYVLESKVLVRGEDKQIVITYWCIAEIDSVYISTTALPVKTKIRATMGYGDNLTPYFSQGRNSPMTCDAWERGYR